MAKFTTERTGEILRISPSVASQWLTRNTSNRPLSRIYKESLARAMKRGEWIENGESIKFADDGSLLDGQHRLAAIIESGVTICSRVEFGLPTEAFITLDRGKRRDLGDALAMRGVADYHLVAAAVNLVYVLQPGKWQVLDRATPLQLLAFYETDCDGIGASVAPTRHASKLVPGSIAVALHFLFAKRNQRLADDFMALLGAGTNMDVGHPVLVLRERLIADRAAKASLPRVEIIVMFIRAWNAFVSNRTLRALKGTVGDSGIPDIIGPAWTGEAAS